MSIMTKAQRMAAQAQAQALAAAQVESQQLRAAEADYAALQRISGGATGMGTAMESNIRAAAEKVAKLRGRRRG